MVGKQNHGGDDHLGDESGARDESADVTESTVEGPVTGSDASRHDPARFDGPDFGTTGRFELADLDRLGAAKVDDDSPDDPVDISAVQSDDRLLSMLAGEDSESDSDDADGELQALLLSWREETEAEELPPLVDVETATATIAAAKRRSRTRHWHLTPLSAAAAILVVAFLGVGLAAKDAQPGDTLWGVTQVLYSQHAKSVTAAVEARQALNTAQVAIQDGKIDEAKDALQRAQTTLKSVAVEDGHDYLAKLHTTLAREVGTGQSPSGTTDTSSSASRSSSAHSSAASTTPPPSSPSSPPSTSSSRPSPSSSASSTPPRPTESLFPSTPPRPSDGGSTSNSVPPPYPLSPNGSSSSSGAATSN